MSSAASYSSRAPLIPGASSMGYSGPQSPAPSVPSLDMSNYPLARPGTSNSQRSVAQRPQLSRVPTHATTGSGSSFGGPFADSPAAYGSDMRFPPPVRSPTNRTMDSYGRPAGREDYYSEGRSSPAPSQYSARGPPPMPRNPREAGPGYQQPTRSATNPMPPRGPQYPPQRNMTAPGPPRQPQGGEDYFNRPGTAQSQRVPPRGPGYGNNYDVESQQDRRY